jgi:hypothetical protein
VDRKQMLKQTAINEIMESIDKEYREIKATGEDKSLLLMERCFIVMGMVKHVIESGFLNSTDDVPYL